MRLVELCVMTLRYTSDVHVVCPFGGAGLGWGVGDGTVTGNRLTGSVQWSNHPTRRSDGTWLPDVRGVVTTAGGAEVVVELQGRTTFTEDGGHQMLFVTFHAEDPAHQWLNQVVCVGEGRFPPDGGTRISVFVCETEEPGPSDDASRSAGPP